MSALDDLISEIGDLLTTVAPLTPDQQAALQRYGGYQLQWDDNDTTNPPLYEGAGRTAPDTLPAPGADGYVTVLQKDLQALGIMPALPVTGIFDMYTSWQLREFQIYAGMDTVATVSPNVVAGGPLADRLVATPNAAKYTGDITGRLDGATAFALQAWQTNGYACPVVAESRDQAGILVVDNVWFGSEDAQKGHRCWVTDLTGTYNVDPARIAAQGALATAGTHPRILVGSYTTSGFGNGPVCERGTAWTDNTVPHGTDITIKTLTGNDLNNASAATISTYNVIRAISHVESPENFDVINGYDSGRISLSPYHFTLYLLGGPSEMPAFLSYLAATLPDEYSAALSRYGIALDRVWPTDGTDPAGNALYDRGQRKWAAFPRQIGLQVASGSVSTAQTKVTSGDDCDYFRTWHWFYRWIMACRMFPDIWHQCWNLCRYRIQALLAAPFPNIAGLPAGINLGQVYTSEYAVAALLRAHVNVPAAVIASRNASATVVNSLTGELGADPSLGTTWPNWTNAQHQAVDLALVEGLLATAANHKDKNNQPAPWPYGKDLMSALGYVSDTGIALSQDAGSFQFDPP
jgi:hypothetical protein